MKAAYRKFGIRGPITPGDDFAMMREVLQRRFTRALKEQAEGAPAGEWPDVVLIDGGAGQLSAAREVLDDLGVQDVKLVAIAKGPDRDAGREWFHTDGMAPFQLPPRDPVLYFLQRLRDEAHRFAITTHRAGRSKSDPGERARRDRRHRRRAQAGAAQPLRFGARGEDGGAGGSGGGAGDQPRDRTAGVRAFPSGCADGECVVRRKASASSADGEGGVRREERASSAILGTGVRSPASRLRVMVREGAPFTTCVVRNNAQMLSRLHTGRSYQSCGFCSASGQLRPSKQGILARIVTDRKFKPRIGTERTGHLATQACLIYRSLQFGIRRNPSLYQAPERLPHGRCRPRLRSASQAD